MLTVKNLSASVPAKEILKGINLHIPAGEVHAVMGPNGAGKSTLSHILAGRTEGLTLSGEVTFKEQDLLAQKPEERAIAGMFLAFQYPIELPGVVNAVFLRTAMNAARRATGQPEIDPAEFMKLAKVEMSRLSMPADTLKRQVNVGFSGGEKKRNEMLQMALLKPDFAILDETDSGLDVDALKIVTSGVKNIRSPHFSALIITHYHRMLEYLMPDRIHILVGGKIVRSGGMELAQELDKNGYRAFTEETAHKKEA